MSSESLRGPRLRPGRARTLLQVGVALFVLSMVAATYIEQTGVAFPAWWPHLQGICPIAMVESLGALVQGDGFADPTRANTWMLIGSLLLAVFFGPLFCGWICPLGAVQDWIGSLGRRVLGKRFNRFVPIRVDRALSWLRFAVLALILVQSVRFIGFASSSINPSRALFHLWFGGAFPVGIAVLAVVLVGSLFVARPWCRWLCPYGAVQGTVSLVSPWTIRRAAAECPSCARCARACPMGIDVHQVTAVRDTRCTRCMECVHACRIDGVLVYATRTTTLRKSTAIAAIAALVYFAPVAIARGAGAYRPPGAQTTPALAAEDIAATMTLGEIAAGVGITVAELLAILEMDPGFDAATRVFDIEEDERYEHVTVAFVRSQLARPAQSE